MRSGLRGTHISDVEVTNVSPHGFWLLVDEHELFVPFEAFPWFEDATVRELGQVERPSPHHLYWPALDVDLALDSLEHPERYPLVSRVRPASKRSRSSRPTTRTRRA